MPSKFQCSYCSTIIHRDYTTKLPKRDDLREAWFAALGKDFQKTCASTQYPVICLNHFKEVRNCRRSFLSVPRPLPYRNTELGKKVKRTRKQRRKITGENKKTEALGGEVENFAEIVEVDENPREEVDDLPEDINQPDVENRDAHRTERAVWRMPIKHCYMCGFVCEDPTPNAGSMVRTILCLHHPITPNPHAFPIYPWREPENEINQMFEMVQFFN